LEYQLKFASTRLVEKESLVLKFILLGNILLSVEGSKMWEKITLKIPASHSNSDLFDKKLFDRENSRKRMKVKKKKLEKKMF
jgi:hypothetical protein